MKLYFHLLVALYLSCLVSNVCLAAEGLTPTGKGSTSSTSSTKAEPLTNSTSAHPFVQTIANVFVNKKTMTVWIKSSADELDLIHEIIPLENGKYDTEELLEGVDIHAEFLLERFQIYGPDDELLKGKVVEKPRWEIPEEGVNSGRLIDYMLEFRFEYEYEAPPERLTFQNDIIDYNFALPSEVKLVVNQAGSDVPYAEILKHRDPKTVDFDWDKPLQNHMSGDQLREWFKEKHEKTLGLTSYGGVYSFIYITPREVRHEVLVPLANLKEMVRFKQADPWFLEVDEQDAARTAIETFFSEGNPVTINGQLVQPVFDRFDFGASDVVDFGKERERKRISLAAGRVGVIMSFPTRNIPDEVTVQWNKFSKMLRDVDVVLITPAFEQKPDAAENGEPEASSSPTNDSDTANIDAPADDDGKSSRATTEKVERLQFSKFYSDEKNTITWRNTGIPALPEVVDVQVDRQYQQMFELPLISLLCVIALFILLLTMIFQPASITNLWGGVVVLGIGAALAWPYKTSVYLPFIQQEAIDSQDADEVFSTLHTNLFRAFDYHTEDDVYDALARTTDGDLLRRIYLEMRKSLEVEEQGGAVTNIDRIEIMDGTTTDESVNDQTLASPNFAYRCTWELEGTVEHWGHIHRRTNRYEGLFNVERVDGLWKFTDFQTINEEQGQIVRSVRKF